MKKVRFYERLSLVVKDAILAINEYAGEKAVLLPTGEVAIDNDDAWIVLGGEEPIIRDKREQRIRERYLKEGREYPDTESSQEFMLDAWDYEDICGYADNLFDLQ